MAKSTATEGWEREREIEGERLTFPRSTILYAQWSHRSQHHLKGCERRGGEGVRDRRLEHGRLRLLEGCTSFPTRASVRR